MEILTTIGKIFLVLLAIASVALPLISERHNYHFVWSVWRRFRIKMFFECLSLVILTSLLTITLWLVPGLNYGWVTFFFKEGGNLLIGPVMEGTKSNSVAVRILVPIFFIVLTFILPFLARSEERIFRRGHDSWRSVTKQSIKFGLMHCLVGVPLAAGIALILSGLFYGLKYKNAFERNVVALGRQRAEDEAVMISITYHTMYNTILILFLLLITSLAV